MHHDCRCRTTTVSTATAREQAQTVQQDRRRRSRRNSYHIEFCIDANDSSSSSLASRSNRSGHTSHHNHAPDFSLLFVSSNLCERDGRSNAVHVQRAVSGSFRNTVMK
jgi:hypothetical protein